MKPSLCDSPRLVNIELGTLFCFPCLYYSYLLVLYTNKMYLLLNKEIVVSLRVWGCLEQGIWVILINPMATIETLRKKSGLKYKLKVVQQILRCCNRTRPQGWL